MEKRKQRKSAIVPIVFFLLELIMIWLTLSLFNWDLYLQNWNIYSYPVALLWLAIIGFKLKIVVKRQKAYNV